MMEHFVIQWMSLAARVLTVMGLGLLTGWGATLLLLPPRFSLRWIVFSPVLGMALVTVIGLPLSLLGLPIKVFASALVLGLAAGGIGVTFILRRRHPLLRQWRIFAYVRARGIRLLVIYGIVTALSTFLMTTRAQSDVSDYWGSGDLGGYWSVSEYLLHYGGNGESYSAQTEFGSEHIHFEIVRGARLGNMVYLAFVVGTLAPEHVHRLYNPIIVASMVLLIALSMTWLESMRCRPFWVLLIAACHPFLYFLLFFSYAAQSTSVVLTFAAFMTARHVLFHPLPRVSAVCGSLAGGGLFAAAMLHYSVMVPVIGLILVVLFVLSLRSPIHRNSWDIFLRLVLTLTVLSIYYIPASWRELTALRGAVLPGWNWQRPIAFSEIAGLRTVLGYGLPSPMATGFSWTLELFGGIFLIAGAALAWFGGRDRVVTFTLGGFTTLAAASALVRTMQHVPNASHSYVKAISLFAIILTLAALAGWAQLFARLTRWGARIAVALLIFVWIPCELRALRFGSYQGPRYQESLVELTRRQTARGVHVWLAFWPPNDANVWQTIKDPLVIQPIVPIVRNVAWLSPVLDGSALAVKISHANQGVTGTVIDSAPPYVVTALTPDTRGQPQ